MDEENQTPAGISRIMVQGFKSLAAESSIEIGNLTLLAGANSSGKSSIMQPLLMLKQTLEASYDPGPLLLNGPHIKFTSAEQFLSKLNQGNFSINLHAIGLNNQIDNIKIVFQRQPEYGLTLKEMSFIFDDKLHNIHSNMSLKEIINVIPPSYGVAVLDNNISAGKVIGERCFLAIQLITKTKKSESWHTVYFSGAFERFIRSLIHLPGLRNKPERTNPLTSVGQIFHGTFDAYVATLIHHWQKNKSAKIEELKLALQTVGLGNNIQATRLNDIEVELKVSRLSHKNEADNNDLVSIADVGFGVSQTLPVLVALLTAKPGQLVYLEQPEIHLHPRAQVALAQILAAAAKRGVKVVAETHSSLLLLGVQTLIAEGELDPELVRLHWFTRGEDGTTTISSVTPDETGAFGDWPEDFADVSLKAQSRYMDAVDILWSRKKR